MSTVKLNSKQLAKVKRAIKSLDSVRQELQSHHPEAYINWYLEDCGNLNLLSGDSHDASVTQGGSNRDNVIEEFDLPNSSGGGW